MYMRKEAVLSSQIEGTQSSLHDLLAAESELLTPSLPKDVNEVINYVNAMNHGLEILPSLPVSIRLIREIHRRLLHDGRGSHLEPGELRRSQNWIGPSGCTLKEAIFVPPPPHELPNILGQLEHFMNDPGNLPDLIWIGLCHAQFESIHPFLDGNGRLGRLLITFLLCERNLLKSPVLYLSYFLKKHRQQYYDELQSVRDHGTWEKWLEFFLLGVKEVSEQATNTISKILLLREEHRKLIQDNFGGATANGLNILEYLCTNPVVRVVDVQRVNNTSYAAANNLVARMVDHSILHEFTGNSRNRRFMYYNYVELFHDDTD